MRDLSLHLLDIMQNSVEAEATKISVMIAAAQREDELRFIITDNGKGMDEDVRRKVTDPFVTARSTRTVGMGLSLFEAAAEQSSGYLGIQSASGHGTTVTAVFLILHIDRPPLGSIAETITTMVTAHPEIEYELLLSCDKKSFYCCTRDLQEQLGEVPLNHPEVLSWLKSYIEDYTKALFGGVLDEVDC